MTELLKLNRRRLARLSLAIALIIGALPFVTPVAAQDAESPLAPVTLTFTIVEEPDPGIEWMDAEGNFHFRGGIEIDTVSGAIEGDATLKFDGDGMLTEGLTYLTVTLDITDENGGWDGYAGLTMVDEYEEQSVGAMLIGRGGNAGKVIAIDTIVMEEEGTITLSGQMLTMERPTIGVNFNYDLCFTGPDSASGGFLAYAPYSDAGAASAEFQAVGAPAPRVIVGNLTFQTERGTLNAMLVETNAEGTPHNFGYMMLMGGTGDYANLYGWGHTKETVSFGEDGGCAGPSGKFIGEAFAG